MIQEIKLSEVVNKAALARMQREFIDEILECNVNPLDAILAVNAVAIWAEGIKKHDLVKDCVLEELTKYGSKTVKYKGATWTQKDVGVKYDYAGTDDPVILRLYTEKEKLDAKIKEREAFLKMIPEGGINYVDSETGEVTLLFAPAKQATEGYSVTIDK